MGWAALLLILTVLGAISWRARYTRGVPFRDLCLRVAEFLDYAAVGGVLEMRHEASAKIIQVAFQSRDTSRRTVEFGLPEMDWSQDFFGDCLSAAERAGLCCVVEEGPENAPVKRFLSIIIDGEDAEEISEKVHRLLVIFKDSMKLEESDTFKIRYRGGINPRLMQRD